MEKLDGQRKIDAFLAYHAGEEQQVRKINHWLKRQGVLTHYVGDAIKPVDPIDDSYALTQASSLVVFLGKSGWSQAQANEVAHFQSSGRQVIPVLVGGASKSDMEALDGIFRKLPFYDLRDQTEHALHLLLQAIWQARGNVDSTPDFKRYHDRPNEVPPESDPVSERVEQLLLILKQGNHRSCREALKQIESLDWSDKAALASALRGQLTGPLATAINANYPIEGIEQNRLTSIRSWMLVALIQLDSEGSQELILRHIDEAYEKNRYVRYWTLASLWSREVSFKKKAIELGAKDAQLEIRWLAQLMMNPDDPSTIEEMEGRLRSPDFDRGWEVLRALRIVPVPKLAPLLSELLFSVTANRSHTYDVLHALTTVPMAKEAAPLLHNRWGSQQVTRKIVEVIASSEYLSGDNFVSLLSFLEPASTLAELKRCLDDQNTRHAAYQLLQQLRRLNEHTANRIRNRPGFHSDKPGDTKDHLGIAAEAKTFAAIMMAKDVHPPLAIGLFGDWGSGKSFFMGEMQRQASQLSQQAQAHQDSPFCSQVAHIEFNAWHYADSNLWASLVSCMLEKLHGRVSGLKTPAEERAELDREMVEAVKDQQKAVLIADQAAEELRRKNDLLAAAEAERHQRQVSITELRVDDWQRLITSNPAAKEAINDIAQRLGIAELTDKATDWHAMLGELRSEAQASVSLAKTVTTQSRKPLWVALFVAFLVIPPLTILVLQVVAADQQWMVKFGAVISQIAAVLTCSAAWARGALSAFTERRKNIEAASNWVNELLQAKRDEIPKAEQQLRDDVRTAQTAKVDADTAVITSQARLSELENAREKISLARFLSDRHRSDDYRKQLGIFTTIRRDFEMLVERLTPEEDQPQQLERIILYIDDLDRCPAEKVVEVLQAVHLLLAYPLFVVVAGVDSRWLLHSLSSHFKQFDDNVAKFSQGENGQRSKRWSATPQHYLEKIFQIPYALRPMTDNGFGQMIDALLAPSTEEPPIDAMPESGSSRPPPSDPSMYEGSASVTQTYAQSVGSVTRPTPLQDISSRALTTDSGSLKIPAVGESALNSQPVFDDAALAIQPWETEYAKRLHAFIPSPRAAKRFSNVYRILKAGVASNELQHFEGTFEFPGEFRLAMVLLAIHICVPHHASRMFPPLSSQLQQDRWDTALRAEAEASDSIFEGPIATALDEFLIDSSMNMSIERAHHWASIVSRFSFDIAHRRG